MNGKIKLFTKKNKGILILTQGKKRQDEKINRTSRICIFLQIKKFRRQK